MAVEGIPGLLRWAPFMSFKAGERFAAPNGDIVTANINFTSGASYSATNVTPSVQDDRIGALEVLGGISPGNTSDAAVVGLLSSATDTRNALDARYVNETDASSLVTGMVTDVGDVQTALDARYVNELDAAGMVTGAGSFQTALDNRFAPDAGGKPVGKGELVYNIKDWGVVPGSGADVTALINTAAAWVYALNPANPYARLYFPAGTYKITDTVRFRCGLDASNATFEYYGAGTAVVIGSDAAPNTVTVRQTFYCPRVINKSRGNVYWDGTSVGIKTINLNTCQIYTPFIQDFSQGLLVYGYSGGNAYNTYNLGALWENQKNLVLDTDATGYTNQNTFLGGRLQHSATKGAFVDDPDACQIYMATAFGGGPNNNIFINVSMEGLNIGYYRLDISGKYNHFEDCRWEAEAGVTPRVRWRATAQWNVINGGYNSQSIVETFDGTLGGGKIYDYLGAYTKALTTAGQVIPTATWTKVTSWATPVGRRITYDGAGNFKPRPGRWRVMATICFATNATGRRMARVSAMGAITDIYEVPGNANRNSIRVESTDNYDGTGVFFVEVQQTSGADLALETTAPYVKITAEYLGV